jgi:hypothetical protein
VKKLLTSTILFIISSALLFGQSPIVRVKQLGSWDTPKLWWKDQTTQQLQTFLAEDPSTPAYKNNNFDIWRDDIVEIEITLDDVGSDITAFRFDIAFDNDIFTWVESGETNIDAWSQGNSKVVKGSQISGWTEGDESSTADYSFEVTYYSNVGYTDTIQSSGNEVSASSQDYDWLRITMVSHGADANADGIPDFTFGNGTGTEAQLIKLYFKVDDVVDNYQTHSFRVPTLYNGGSGYYTYVSDEYLLDYKVYIDGNWGTDATNNGGARGDMTLHPKLVDVEGFGRYIGEFIDADGDGTQDAGEFVQNDYPYWKVVFELDENNPDTDGAGTATPYPTWYNIENIADDSNTADEDLSDDVIGDNTTTFYHYKFDDNSEVGASDQTINGTGFKDISYWDFTYTDDKGYYNIALPRNNTYRVSFWPPDADDYIATHDPLELDRGAITNINDAIASFNFQSAKYKNSTSIDIESPSGYLIGDVDGDDVFQLNDTYFLWAYVSGVFDTEYTHANGNTYQQWSSIDNLKANGSAETLSYYQTLRGVSYPQRREFTVFWDNDLDQENETLNQGQVEILNPLMDDVQTGLDTLQVSIGAGTSAFQNDVNPDYTQAEIATYFTGDMNLTGTKVLEPSGDGYQSINGTTYYRWGNGTPPTGWARTTDRNLKDFLTNPDVLLSLPADSTVKVQSGNQVVVPLTIAPQLNEEGIPVNVAGFEFEFKYNTNELQFIDAQTGLLPGPWLTYLNESEVDDLGYKTVSFGGLDNSPNNAPQSYYITEEMIGLELVFTADFPDAEWTEADLTFVGKANAGNPNGDDLLMQRQDGTIMVWNKYWAFGGGKPEEDDITYIYPNPFAQSTNFQFFMEQSGNAKISIYNPVGQLIGVVLDEQVSTGIHTFDFTNSPNIWLPGVSVFLGYETLKPGIYLFVLETDNKIKSKKFTVIK